MSSDVMWVMKQKMMQQIFKFLDFVQYIFVYICNGWIISLDDNLTRIGPVRS